MKDLTVIALVKIASGCAPTTIPNGHLTDISKTASAMAVICTFTPASASLRCSSSSLRRAMLRISDPDPLSRFCSRSLTLNAADGVPACRARAGRTG